MNLKRAKVDLERIAKEVLELDQIGGAIYAFGSELACLRLFHKYRHCGDRVATGFSENLKTWYFRLETL